MVKIFLLIAAAVAIVVGLVDSDIFYRIDIDATKEATRGMFLSISAFLGVSIETVVWTSLALLVLLFFSSFLKIFAAYRRGMIIASALFGVPSVSYFLVMIQSMMR